MLRSVLNSENRTFLFSRTLCLGCAAIFLNFSDLASRLFYFIYAWQPYCRVSTGSDEQATSYEAQVEHYTEYIHKNPEWEFAGIFADDGITGTNTKKRTEFNRMIDACMAGEIDMIITKSISRFARNTLDCLKYIRQLKEKNIPV